MELPWVSRARYGALKEITDALREDRAELKETVRDLQDRLARVAEVANKVPKQSPRGTRESIPKEVDDEIKAYDSHVVRRQLRYEARQAHAQGESWDSIRETLRNARPVGVEG